MLPIGVGPEKPKSSQNTSNPWFDPISVKSPLRYCSHLFSLREKNGVFFFFFSLVICPVLGPKYPNVDLLSALVEAWPGRLGGRKGPSFSRDGHVYRRFWHGCVEHSGACRWFFYLFSCLTTQKGPLCIDPYVLSGPVSSSVGAVVELPPRKMKTLKALGFPLTWDSWVFPTVLGPWNSRR